jgi:hypothetical protein
MANFISDKLKAGFSYFVSAAEAGSQLAVPTIFRWYQLTNLVEAMKVEVWVINDM